MSCFWGFHWIFTIGLLSTVGPQRRDTETSNERSKPWTNFKARGTKFNERDDMIRVGIYYILISKHSSNKNIFTA